MHSPSHPKPNRGEFEKLPSNDLKPGEKRHKKATCHIDEGYPSAKTSTVWFLAGRERSLMLGFKGHQYRLTGLNREPSEQFLQKHPVSSRRAPVIF